MKFVLCVIVCMYVENYCMSSVFKSITEGKTHQKPMTYVYVYNLYVQNEWITSQARAVLPTVVTGNQM